MLLHATAVFECCIGPVSYTHLDVYKRQGNKNVKIGRQPDLENIRHNTKLSFIPSERNLATALKNVDRVYN